jgi:hypothetical protein
MNEGAMRTIAVATVRSSRQAPDDVLRHARHPMGEAMEEAHLDRSGLALMIDASEGDDVTLAR